MKIDYVVLSGIGGYKMVVCTLKAIPMKIPIAEFKEPLSRCLVNKELICTRNPIQDQDREGGT
jgi:hypothetical protein